MLSANIFPPTLNTDTSSLNGNSSTEPGSARHCSLSSRESMDSCLSRSTVTTAPSPPRRHHRAVTTAPSPQGGQQRLAGQEPPPRRQGRETGHRHGPPPGRPPGRLVPRLPVEPDDQPLFSQPPEKTERHRGAGEPANSQARAPHHPGGHLARRGQPDGQLPSRDHPPGQLPDRHHPEGQLPDRDHAGSQLPDRDEPAGFLPDGENSR